MRLFFSSYEVIFGKNYNCSPRQNLKIRVFYAYPEHKIIRLLENSRLISTKNAFLFDIRIGIIYNKGNYTS